MPISEQVELDIGAALSSVDDIGSALASNVTQFRADLSDALAALAAVPVSVDEGTLTTSVDDALAASSSSVPVVADQDVLGGSIDEALNALQGSALVVEGDTTPLAGDIEAATGPQTVPLDGDTSQLQADIEAAAQGSTTTITVEADTAAADQQLADFTTQATDATSAAGGLTDSLGLLASASSSSGTNVTGLASSVGAAIPGFGAVATAVTAVAGANSAYVDSAINAKAASDRFNQSFGDQAKTVQDIDIGGLNTSLADLNLTLGSSTSQVRNALSTYAQLGEASGASSEQIATFAQQVEVLSARAVALNPNLGSVGDVAERIGGGLARGGRFAGQFGLSLNAAEIQARALADTGKQSADQLSLFEKQAAGAAIATEKLGTSLQQDIAQGSQNPIIQLREISAEFAKFTTALGAPLIAPAFDLLRSIQPTLLAAAKLLGVLGQAIAPVANALVDSLGPILSGTLQTLGNIISAQTIPNLQQIATIITSLLVPATSTLQPLFDAVVKLFIALQGAVAPLLASLVPVAELFGTLLGSTLSDIVVPALSLVIEGLARIIELAQPLQVVLAPLQLLGNSIKGLTGDTNAAADSMTGLSVSVRANVTTVEELRAKTDETRKGFGDFIVTQSEFSKDPAILDSLRRTGVGMDRLQGQLGNLDQGLKDFVASAIESGQVKITANGADVSAGQIRALDGTLTDYLNTQNVAVIQGNNLVQSFVNQSLATDQQAQANFAAIASQQGLTDAQVAAIGVQAQQQLGVDSYSNRLTILAGQQQGLVTDQAATTGVLQGNAGAWVALTQAVANGSLTTDNAAGAAQLLGVNVDTARGFIENAGKAIDTFVQGAVSKMPTATSVFEDLKTATNPNDPQSFANNLNAATIGALTFQQNIDTIAQKFPEVAKVLQEQGPEAAGAFAQSFLGASEEVQRNVESAIIANRGALKTIGDDIRNSIGDNTAAAASLGESVAGQLGQKMDFGNVTKSQVTEITKALQFSGVIDPAKDAADTSGQAIGDTLGAGIALGMSSKFPDIENQAREAIRRAKAAADAEAQTGSPSKLFAETGEDLSAGLALGMDRAGALVVAAAEQIVRDAAAATGAGALNLPTLPDLSGLTPAAATGAPIVFQFDVTVTPPVGMSPEEARTVGEQVVQGAASELDAMLAAIRAG